MAGQGGEEAGKGAVGYFEIVRDNLTLNWG